MGKMVETIRPKNIVKLFLLIIALWLLAIAIPDTFSDSTYQGQIERYTERLTDAKSNLEERTLYFFALTEEDFTAETWIRLETSLIKSQHLIENLDQLLLNAEKTLTEHETATTHATKNSSLLDHIHQLQNTLTEIEQIYEELEDAYTQLEIIDQEEIAEGNIADEATDENRESENEEENDNSELEAVRAELYSFLTYLNQALLETEISVQEWEKWQTLIAQAWQMLDQSDTVEELNYILEQLQLLYQSHNAIHLLSLTRSEFNKMSPYEIAEMAKEGGYIAIEVLPNITPATQRLETNACTNIDGANFITNVIVDGVVCISDSTLNLQTRIDYDATAAASFISGWQNAAVTTIILMNDITIHNTTLTPRVNSIRIESNNTRNTLALTASAGTNPTLTLNAASGGGSILSLNNIRLRRDNTGTTTATGQQNTASALGIINSTAVNSENWQIRIYNNVVTGDEGTTRATVNNISGLIHAPRAQMTVIGRQNQLNIFALGADSHTTTTHQIHVQNFEMLPDSQLTLRSHGSAAASLRIDNVQTFGGSRLTSTLTVSRPGSVILRPNAQLTILNAGNRNDTDGGTGGAAEPGRGHGIHGFISTFLMESESIMNIDVVGVGFRSRTRTEYTMTGGAVKTILARPTATNGNAAFVLAYRNNTGTTAPGGTTADNNMRNRAPIHNHAILLEGAGTQLNLVGSPTAADHSMPRRSNVFIAGDGSTFTVRDQAELNNTSHRSTAMIFFGQGTVFNVNSGGRMNIIANGAANADAGAFRFLQTGGQTFNLSDGAVSITANGGSAGLLRAYGGDNAFYVRNGGLLELIHNGTGTARGVDFANGNSTVATADRFIVGLPLNSPDRTTPLGVDCRSEVFMRINNGRAVDGDTGSSMTRVEAHPGSVFEIEANSPGDAGVFRAGNLQLQLNTPLYFDFTNTSHTRATAVASQQGLLFETGGSSAIIGNSTDLSIWRNTRGTATMVDHIHEDPGAFFNQMDFNIRPTQANFANRDLRANSGQANDVFQGWFNNAANMGTLTTTGDAGWRQIRRMSANNAHPIVDILRTPTDADQRIFGHVTVPEGNRSARSAFENEVFVDLIINNSEGDFVQRINNIPTGTRSTFYADEHMGVFEAVIDFSVGFDVDTTFLPANYTVEVARARRTSVPADVTANKSITVSENIGTALITGAYNHRESNSESHPQNILVDIERVRDITPPKQVEEVIGLVNGIERFDGIVTPATTTITGTGEPYAYVRVAIVTPPTNNLAVDGIYEWLGNPVQVDEVGQWSFSIPTGTNLAVGDRLSIYITDGEGIDDLLINSLDEDRVDPSHVGPNNLVPEVIYRRVPGDETLYSREDILHFELPRTVLTVPWADAGNEPIGNMGYHWAPNSANTTEFHDAIVDDAFHYAYILTVQEVLESDFEFTKVREFTRSGLPGATFHLYRWDEDDDDWETVPHLIVTSATTPAGEVVFEGLSHGGQYRLREHFAAPGFVDLHTDHYWVITVANNGDVTWASGNTNTPDFDVIYEDEDDEENDNYTLELVNTHIVRDTDFEFIKESDLTGLPLEGAEFRLYRLDEDGETWNRIYESEDEPLVLISDEDGIISIPDLRYGGQYRIIEILAPANYDLPPTGHHWIINVNINNGSITLPTHQANAPAFIDRDGNFYLPNVRSIVDEWFFAKIEEEDIDAPLPGAVFELFRWVEDDDHIDGGEWESVVHPDYDSAYPDTRYFVSADPTGRVDFEGILTYGSRYRLIEIEAPEDFMTPADGHYWLIIVGSNGNIATPTHHEGAPAFIEGEDDYEGELFLPNLPAGNPFSFFKTNDYLYLDADENDPTVVPGHSNLAFLAGAVFELRRLEENGEFSDVIETATSQNAPNLGLVEFEHLLTTDGTYKLVEIQAPSGFRIPHGYWIISWNSEINRFDFEAGGTISLVPAFRFVRRNEEGTYIYDYYLGNFPETLLPATGGLGAMSLTLLGGLSIAFVGLLYLRRKISDRFDALEQ